MTKKNSPATDWRKKPRMSVGKLHTQEILRLRRAKYSYQKISEHVGVSDVTVAKICRTAGLGGRRAKATTPVPYHARQSVWDHVIALRREGLTHAAIAGKLKIHLITVTGILSRVKNGQLGPRPPISGPGRWQKKAPKLLRLLGLGLSVTCAANKMGMPLTTAYRLMRNACLRKKD